MMHVRVYLGCITIITAFGDSFMPIIPGEYDKAEGYFLLGVYKNGFGHVFAFMNFIFFKP